MAAHMVFHEPFHGKSFSTYFARKLQLVPSVSSPDMVQEFGSVGKEASTGRTANLIQKSIQYFLFGTIKCQKLLPTFLGCDSACALAILKLQ